MEPKELKEALLKKGWTEEFLNQKNIIDLIYDVNVIVFNRIK